MVQPLNRPSGLGVRAQADDDVSAEGRPAQPLDEFELPVPHVRAQRGEVAGRREFPKRGHLREEVVLAVVPDVPVSRVLRLEPEGVVQAEEELALRPVRVVYRNGVADEVDLARRLETSAHAPASREVEGEVAAPVDVLHVRHAGHLGRPDAERTALSDCAMRGNARRQHSGKGRETPKRTLSHQRSLSHVEYPVCTYCTRKPQMKSSGTQDSFSLVPEIELRQIRAYANATAFWGLGQAPDICVSGRGRRMPGAKPRPFCGSVSESPTARSLYFTGAAVNEISALLAMSASWDRGQALRDVKS